MLPACMSRVYIGPYQVGTSLTSIQPHPDTHTSEEGVVLYKTYSMYFEYYYFDSDRLRDVAA